MSGAWSRCRRFYLCEVVVSTFQYGHNIIHVNPNDEWLLFGLICQLANMHFYRISFNFRMAPAYKWSDGKPQTIHMANYIFHTLTTRMNFTQYTHWAHWLCVRISDSPFKQTNKRKIYIFVAAGRNAKQNCGTSILL